MQLVLVGSLGVLALGSLALAQAPRQATADDFTIERPFVEGGRVHLRMRAGEIQVKGIDGHKDIRMTAGISKSGIKRSLDWIGGGTYALDARLGAGDLTIARMP